MHKASLELKVDLSLDLLKKKKAKRYLTDTTQSRVVGPDDQNWIATNWRVRAVEAGLKKMATIMPQDLIAKMVMRRLSSLINGADIGYFDSLDEAKSWLVKEA